MSAPDAGPGSLDPAAFRERFPVLRRLTHLSSCSLGAPSTDVEESLRAVFGAMYRTASPWPEWEVEIDDARARLAGLLGAKPADVAVVPHATQGAYLAVCTADLVRRPRLVVSAEDFPTIAHVALAQRRLGAEVVFVPAGEPEEVVRGYAEAIDERTSLVFLPSTTFLRGVRLPVARIAALAHASGARVFVDAYQSVGVEPVDVAAWDVDYLVTGSQKYMLGVPGLAFLYVRPGLADEREPLLTGWFGRVDPDAFDPYTLDFADGARRLETGNHAVPAAYAAAAALRLLERADPARVRRHVAGLTARAAALLTEAGETLAGPSDPRDRGAHLALCDPDPQALSAWLVSRDVRIAPRGAFARISFHHFNNEDDVDLVCAQIRAYRERGGR
ncbi:aminotransferase class V-fold PLP-dependent enzyme [Streptomyces sp. NPDC048606]|uniref:aminotransferase class V-fold PLP-dependent enzyme n=1 Tax=Streptomyces sp. NPDC048606 TaxID=3154726 RepID=UPI0034403561